MAITFCCPTCNAAHQMPDEAAGRKGRCKHCGTMMTIPVAEAVVATSAGHSGANGRRAAATSRSAISLPNIKQAGYQWLREKSHWTRKQLAVAAVVGVVGIFLASLVWSGGSRSGNPLASISDTAVTRKAKELMQLEMYPQAKTLLLGEISQAPTDADLHFLLGMCCLATNDVGEAQISFGRAVRLEPEKGKLIGDAFFAEGTKAMIANKREQALKLFAWAKEYNPALGEVIASKMTDAAIEAMDANDHTMAHFLFQRALDYSASGDVSAVASQAASSILGHLKAVVPESGGTDSSLTRLAELCVQLEPQSSTKVAGLYFNYLAKAVPERGGSVPGLTELADFCLRLDPELKGEIAQLCLTHLAKVIPERGGSEPNLSNLITLCLRIEPELKGEVARLYFAHGKALLESSEGEIERAISNGFEQSVRFDPVIAKEVARFLIAIGHTSSSVPTTIKAASAAYQFDKEQGSAVLGLLFDTAEKKYRAGAIEDFKTVMEAAQGLDFSPVSSDRDRCLKALYLYESGDTGVRLPALEELGSLRESQDEFASSMAAAILSPPSVGRHEVNKSTQTEQISIVLTDYEVIAAKMVLHFIISNLSENQGGKLAYNVREHRPYAVDDNGRKYMSLVSAKDEKQADSSGYIRIPLSPRQSIKGILEFELPKEGARKFTITSPSYDGWTIKDIPLK